MKRLLLFLFLLCSSAWADVVTLKLNTEILVAPKTSPKTNNAILNAYSIRTKLDPANDILFSDLGIQMDTLNKDLPWKLVYVNPSSKKIVETNDKMSIEVISSSQVGVLKTVTPPIIGGVFLLGDIIEYRVVKITLNLGKDTCEAYGAFNVNYRVVRTDTGDHWYPSSSFTFRAPGSFNESTCVFSATLTPPKLSMPSTSYWTQVNRTLIITK